MTTRTASARWLLGWYVQADDELCGKRAGEHDQEQRVAARAGLLAQRERGTGDEQESEYRGDEGGRPLLATAARSDRCERRPGAQAPLAPPGRRRRFCSALAKDASEAVGAGQSHPDREQDQRIVESIIGDAVRGHPVGIDQSPDAVANATTRASERGLSNVRFVVGDIQDPAPGGPFDAIVGRLVLMYVPDPSAVLRAQASVLRAGGVVVPIEVDIPSARSLPPTPLVTRAISWVVEAFKAANVEPALGPRLWSVLLEADFGPRG
jgi:SAM-dependent methyltransferase